MDGDFFCQLHDFLFCEYPCAISLGIPLLQRLMIELFKRASGDGFGMGDRKLVMMRCELTISIRTCVR